jgi:hypothetical protein
VIALFALFQELGRLLAIPVALATGCTLSGLAARCTRLGVAGVTVARLGAGACRHRAIRARVFVPAVGTA